MAYFSERQLKEAYGSRIMDREYRSLITEDRDLAQKTVFLSHSHKDKELVLGLQRYLSKIGLKIYIDWQDSNMPRITNKETALKIKNRIKELEYFFILASENAMKSRWVPWEIGVGDVSKSSERILLIPVSDSGGNYYGNEYLQLYNRLEMDGNIPKIFRPGSSYSSGPLFG